MKILISAFACDPRLGSESYVGYTAVSALARKHECWVLTSERNRPILENLRRSGQLSENLHFSYLGSDFAYHPNRLFARCQNWLEYRDFTNALLPLATKLHRQIGFDLAHHITITTWRIGIPLWKLGIPFIWGPIGGGEKFPAQFYSTTSPGTWLFESARSCSNWIGPLNRSVRDTARNAAHIFVSNQETQEIMLRLRGRTDGISQLAGTFFAEDRIRQFQLLGDNAQRNGPLRLFAGGNLEGRKGVAIALHALSILKNNYGVPFNYTLGGHGPELSHLRKLVSRLDLQSNVSFSSGLDQAAYHANLRDSRFYLLPSLRDNAPVTLMEAMLAGCIPVVADCGGPARLVTEECGWKIPVTNLGTMADTIALLLNKHQTDTAKLIELAKKSSERIATGFSESNYIDTVDRIYHSLS